MAWLAILQLLEIFFIHREVGKIRKLRRIAELSDCDVTREFAQRIDIRCEFKVTLRCRIYVDGAKNKYLIRGRGVQYLRDCLSFADFLDLVVVQANELVEKLAGFGRLVR